MPSAGYRGYIVAYAMAMYARQLGIEDDDEGVVVGRLFLSSIRCGEGLA